MNRKHLPIIALAALMLLGISQSQAAPTLRPATSYNLQSAAPPAGGPIGCRRNSSQPQGSQTLFFDDMENGGQNWLAEGQGGMWQIVTDSYRSPIHAWAAYVPNASSYQVLALAITVTIPLTAPKVCTSFWHHYNFGQGSSDGGVFEYRTDPGTPWQDAGPLFQQNGYTGVISATSNPLTGHPAFVGSSTQYPEYQESLVDITSLAGHSPSFRFILGSDSAGAAPGWHMDDFELYTLPATPTTTPTAEPSATTTPPPPTVTPCADPFVDLNGNIFRPAIYFLYCRGVISGVDSTHYGPAATSTRAQFAKVVVIGFSIPLVTPDQQHFTDVPPSYFAYPYIEAGYAAAILAGYDQATCTAIGATYPCYGPNRPITRAQLTKLVVAAAHYPAYTPTTQTFNDVPPSNVFYTSIETAHHMGIINGYPDNTFRPNNPIRRDEMAQVVYKAITTP